MMPKGVEHISSAVMAVALAVVAIPSMMPKGVEHEDRQGLTEQRERCDSIYDAERR